METVASILGQSGFDVDDTSRSVPAGSESATGSDSERASGSTDNVIATASSNGNVNGEGCAVSPDSATPGTDDSTSGNGNRRRSSANNRRDNANANKRSRADKTEEGEIHLDALLQSLHSILARVIAAPELELSELEAKALASSIKRVTKYITKKVLSPQQEAVGALIVTLAAIYLPRYLIYSARTGGTVVDAENPKVRSVNVHVG